MIKSTQSVVPFNEHKLLLTADRDLIFKKLQNQKSIFNRSENLLITEEAIEEENWAKIPERDKTSILKLYKKLKKGNTKVLDQLLEFKQIYPNVPALNNYLSICYQQKNEQEKYVSILFETIKEFPNYLFGKTALAEYYLNSGEFDKIPAVLNNKFALSQHFPPGTKVFHISAVRSFYFVIGKYFVKRGLIELAYKSYYLISDIDPLHIMAKLLGLEIVGYEMEELQKEFAKNRSQNKKGDVW
jgi:tetratricopeptide (TPR) repeat protein